jgi:DNA-binding CsgD family transcriptional regulator
VERATEQHLVRREGIGADTKLSDVLHLIESNLTIQEVAERLGISVESACALVVASLRSSRART